MKTRALIASATLITAVALGGCANNRAIEGAGLGSAIGAVAGLVTGGNIATGAAIGAAVGGAGGALVKRSGECYRIEDDGRERRVRCP